MFNRNIYFIQLFPYSLDFRYGKTFCALESNSCSSFAWMTPQVSEVYCLSVHGQSCKILLASTFYSWRHRRKKNMSRGFCSGMNQQELFWIQTPVALCLVDSCEGYTRNRTRSLHIFPCRCPDREQRAQNCESSLVQALFRIHKLCCADSSNRRERDLKYHF